MTLLRHIFENLEQFANQNIEVRGWVVEHRTFQNVSFVVINDGSTFQNLQVVFSGAIFDKKTKIGSSIQVEGTLKLTPKAQQPCEVSGIKCTILAQATEDFLIQKNLINLETLREFPHLRHRTRLFRATMAIRSRLALEIHKFFDSLGYLYVHTPILTSNDGEGGGETFVVNSDSKDNFFGANKKAFLTVTGQLHAEAYAQGFGGIYTFGPTFRAELSHTQKHAAEFWMVEPEVAFFELPQIIELADNLLKSVIGNTLKICFKEMEFLDKKHEGLLERLQTFLSKKVQILEYKKAIEILAKNKEKFENQDIKFGLDMNAEHEKFLVEYVKSPVAVINFPKEIKAFYMFQNSDNKTVASFDLLVPGVGELIGGSQRETRVEKLLQRSKELNLELAPLEWYFNLRNFGYSSSSGFGLGFERLVMYVTGVENIRDVIPFPRTAGHIRM